MLVQRSIQSVSVSHPSAPVSRRLPNYRFRLWGVELSRVRQGMPFPSTISLYNRPKQKSCSDIILDQPTWLFHAFRYPSRPLQMYMRVLTVTAQCPARARGTFSSEHSWPRSSQALVSTINNAIISISRRATLIYLDWRPIMYWYTSILSRWNMDRFCPRKPTEPIHRRPASYQSNRERQKQHLRTVPMTHGDSGVQTTWLRRETRRNDLIPLGEIYNRDREKSAARFRETNPDKNSKYLQDDARSFHRR